MKHGYLAHLIAAVALSLAGAMLLAVLPALVGGGSATAILVVVLSGYVLFLLGTAPLRRGRVVAALLWLVASLSAGMLLQPLACAAVLLFGVSLIRTVFHHPGLLSLVLDGVLVALGVGFAWWALPMGPGFALWCFFLAQTFAVWIPGGLKPAVPRDFQTAERDAERALHALVNAR